MLATLKSKMGDGPLIAKAVDTPSGSFWNVRIESADEVGISIVTSRGLLLIPWWSVTQICLESE